MIFNGTIVITDPCYLNDSDNPEIAERLYHLYEDSHCGHYLEWYGCTTYISTNTLCGDWSCATFRGDFDDFLEKYKNYDEDNPFEINDPELGSFCADSGQVCVVYLNEILKTNPDFLAWADTHSWCVTIIPQFDGDVEAKVYNDERFIVGKGNINFYTA